MNREPNDYDPVAGWYDRYMQATYDHDFFLQRVRPGMRVLELTSGTGRLSLPLVRAGVELTCVDISRGMLERLQSKLDREELTARLVCADVSELSYRDEFELVLFPLQSIMEIVGEEQRRRVLASVRRALKPRGRFFCTMHNPDLRGKNVDGVMRGHGHFRDEGGYLVLYGFETGGNPVVQRSQFIERYDGSGRLMDRIFQPQSFELIREGDFREMATGAGFAVENLFGTYDGSPFDAKTSPYMIWELT